MEKTAQQPEPVWELARLFPAQGQWSEEEYLKLPTNHLVEFSRGRLEVLPMPTYSHQKIVRLLFLLLDRFLGGEFTGELMFAPMRIQVAPGKFREPDIVFMLAQHADRLQEQYWIGADLVMEVVSPDNPERDYVTKRREYAQAGIAEYWIVDPGARRITVLALRADDYAVHGEYGAGEAAASPLLPGFVVNTDELFAELDR